MVRAVVGPNRGSLEVFLGPRLGVFLRCKSVVFLTGGGLAPSNNQVRDPGKGDPVNKEVCDPDTGSTDESLSSDCGWGNGVCGCGVVGVCCGAGQCCVVSDAGNTLAGRCTETPSRGGVPLVLLWAG